HELAERLRERAQVVDDLVDLVRALRPAERGRERGGDLLQVAPDVARHLLEVVESADRRALEAGAGRQLRALDVPRRQPDVLVAEQPQRANLTDRALVELPVLIEPQVPDGGAAGAEPPTVRLGRP